MDNCLIRPQNKTGRGGGSPTGSMWIFAFTCYMQYISTLQKIQYVVYLNIILHKMVINMVDLRKLVGVLDAVYNCGNRDCPDCRKLYGMKPTESKCPIWKNKENVLEALKVLEKWLDDEYDINCQLGTKPTYEVSEEEFMNILNGVYMERKEQ